MRKEPRANDSKYPLVSIAVFNFNYGQYLEQCLESVYAQTYPNIEICFSDNDSTDDSWEVALRYADRHPGTMTVTRNRRNFGVEANWANCAVNLRGKYYLQLCSDDTLRPEFVRKCVRALEAHPSAGFALVNRAIIDAKGRVKNDPPFYNRSCLVPGVAQAAVYMMAAVNPSVSQVMYNRVMTYGKSSGGIATRWYGPRLLDFKICCNHDMVYLHESLMNHRLHTMNDSYRAADSLMEVIGPYVLQHQFAEIAKQLDNMGDVCARLPRSLEKLARLCLRYSLRALMAEDPKSALRYFHLSVAIAPVVSSDSTYKHLARYWTADTAECKEIIERLRATSNLTTRTISYDPPPGSVPLRISGYGRPRKAARIYGRKRQ